MKEEKVVRVISYPDKDEITAAQLACCGRVCTECETPAEYAWRKREVDMALLLERAIKKELTFHERSAITLHWFNGESVTGIAQKKGITPAAVRATLDRAQEKLEKVLGYAVCYQQNIMDESIIPLAVGRARVIAAAKNSSGSNCGERIRNLRHSQGLTADSLCAATGINPYRLKKIENCGDADGAELVALSEFFSVTTDYILKGEKNEGN